MFRFNQNKKNKNLNKMDSKDLVKVKNVIKISPDITLSKALSFLSSSHDAAFVFSDDKKYMGVINPYYCFIKSSHPGNSKVEKCLFHPPKVKISFSIAKIAQLMIESKIHYLPVFDDKNNFTGIVSARHLLSLMRDSHLFNLKISNYLKLKKNPVYTIFEDDLVTEAIKSFKTHKISKLVVINKNLKLRGVLAYYDLINYLVTPREKKHRGDREGARTTSFKHNKVINFTKTYVLTLDEDQLLKDAINLILDKSIGSIVIIDKNKHPISVITTRDFLGILNQAYRFKQIEDITANLSEESRRIIGGFFNQIATWLNRIPNLTKINLFEKDSKNPK